MGLLEALKMAIEVWESVNGEEYVNEVEKEKEKARNFKRIKASNLPWSPYSQDLSIGNGVPHNGQLDIQDSWSNYSSYPSSGTYDPTGFDKRLVGRDFMIEGFYQSAVAKSVISISLSASTRWILRVAPLSLRADTTEIKKETDIYPISPFPELPETAVPMTMVKHKTHKSAIMSNRGIGFDAGIQYLKTPKAAADFGYRMRQISVSAELTVIIEAMLTFTQVTQLGPEWTASRTNKLPDFDAFRARLAEEALQFGCVQKKAHALDSLVIRMRKEMQARGVLLNQPNLILAISDDTASKALERSNTGKYIDTGIRSDEQVKFSVQGVGEVVIVDPISTDVGVQPTQFLDNNSEIGEMVIMKPLFLDGISLKTSSQDVRMFDAAEDSVNRLMEYKYQLLDSHLFIRENRTLSSIGNSFFAAIDPDTFEYIDVDDGKWNLLVFLRCHSHILNTCKDRGIAYLRRLVTVTKDHPNHFLDHRNPDTSTVLENMMHYRGMFGGDKKTQKALSIARVRRLLDGYPTDLTSDAAVSTLSVFERVGVDILYRFLELCYEMNITTGIGFIIAHPHIQYTTSMAILIQNEPGLAFCYYAMVTTTVGADGTRQQIAGTLSFSSKCMVLKEQNVCITRGVTLIRYNGGHEITPIVEPEVIQKYRDGEAVDGYFVIALQPHEEAIYETKCIDLTGSFSPYTFNDDKKRVIHYNMAIAYSEYFGWRHIEYAEPGITPYFLMKNTRPNTIMYRGRTQRRKSDTEWEEPEFGYGHFGDTTVANCMEWRNFNSGVAKSYSELGRLLSVK
jgi:hypothetical protein